MIYLFLIGGIICTAVIFLLSIFVYLKDCNNRLNRIFFLYGISATMVFLAIVFWPLEKSDILLGFAFKFLYASMILSAAVFFHFVVTWLKIIENKKKLLATVYSLFIFATALIFSPFFINKVFFLSDRLPWFSLEKFFYIYPVLLFIIFSATAYLLAINYKKSFVSRRAKFKYLFLLLFISNCALVNIVLVSLGIFIWPYGVFLLFVGFITSSYIVLVKRAVELAVVFRNLMLFFSSFVSVALFAVILKYTLIAHFPLFKSWIDFPVLFAALFIFPIVKDFYTWSGNKFVFSNYYDSQKVITFLNNKLRTTISVEKVYEMICDLIKQTFHAKAFCIFNYNEKTKEYFLAYNKGFKLDWHRRFSANQIIGSFYFNKGQAVVVEEAINNENKENDFILMLMRVNAELIIPIKAKHNTVGLIMLGAKESGNIYNNKDMQTLEIIGAQASMAIENALMYQRTKDFNILLEQEVEKATKELREANEKLKKLDSAKSEFISIASHQLRTPLTIIKGYISMIMEGNFGPVSKAVADSLKKVYDSNERLILLVENLLNISRIESGNLQFDFKETDIEELAISAIDELSDTAKKRNNHLVYKPSTQKLPSIVVDSEKIRHVIMNLLDNAIKYSEKGDIVVKIDLEKDRLVLSVTDEGIGIPDEEISNLFRKFYRGNLSPLIHTEGTGLGLFVAKQMIESHKGRIWAKSNGRDKGTTFYFSLPLVVKS
ncbi:MAG: Sensor protein resE [Candidatus Falkowbacteria bacterium GW2011_GWC2_38_22]|uniref:histidine kinase n=1 Tax=Candidatus Falkowbacteria bacterium GW2011_GWE1_38_31 TaxID=1618638 RepID=A0A0G0JTK2_9BACT|nr:MAG: Sensor protein resE [Candidatus Falkowbacteria bacterium GW2011_GWF2_38_1205]KKQ61215.1 MAG: Sensor protein resE [Candidatus Falkowbacteria bacterium GW2011_GWC2_38_22]KKQ63280.1 MAG: Sensor protein resE [Candidatus Falkowbacteria bacterium GW2011_GWF1_38_22]KKQ65602.1 MAG: Sensor protein resE [Candidatus Falkowbacteria bacterium GW2011_GWE2_38_254]KKQ70012.1 MAG: Sensor protein resE [Candidatus Falkowbacteria bacterium GW2011_GWE1_38_31]KKQ72747.1 MAG: Sensor protein resE [Candidatus 